MTEPKSLADLLERLSLDADRIIANPEDMPLLAAHGVQPHEGPPLTVEDAVERLIAAHRTGALERARSLPAPPSAVSTPPAIQSLYGEITACIILGLNGAAITLSAILVEFALKYVTYIREAGGFAKYDPSHWDSFERIAFDAAITRAANAGLVTPEQVEQLRRFKEAVRNPYSHYNIRRITEHLAWDRVKIVNLETGSVEEKKMLVKDDPVLQAQAKPVVDAQQVFRVFEFADGVVKHLLTAIR